MNLKKELGVALVTGILRQRHSRKKLKKNFEQTFQERAPEFNIKLRRKKMPQKL